MKTWFYAYVAVLGIILPAQAAEVGKPAPDFSVKDIKGVAQSISQYKGKLVVLEWNNPECPFVKKHYDHSNNMPKLQQAAKDKGVIWLVVNSGAPGKQGHMDNAQANDYVVRSKMQAASYILDHEGKIGRDYGAKTTPHMYVIAKDGVLAYAGAIDDKSSADAADIAFAKNHVMTAIDELLADKPVSTTHTQAYGCSVKY